MPTVHEQEITHQPDKFKLYATLTGLVRQKKIYDASGIRRLMRLAERVELFCKDMGITYVGHAGKPAKRGYREAMAKAGVTARETAMLGDKLLTDVLGARRSGVLALMVEPLGGPVGAWNHVLHALQAPFKAMTKENYL